MPPSTPDLFGIFFLGMITGSTVCTISCLSYLGPLLVGQGRGFANGLACGLLFIIGKMLCYSALGAMVALGGETLALSPRHAAWLMMTSLFILALSLLRPQKKCAIGCHDTTGRWSFFGLGLVTGLIPCPSLIGLLAMAAASRNPATGALYGMVFGAGLLVSPLIPAAASLGHVGARLRQEITHLIPVLRRVCALILAAAGLKILLAS